MSIALSLPGARDTCLIAQAALTAGIVDLPKFLDWTCPYTKPPASSPGALPQPKLALVPALASPHRFIYNRAPSGKWCGLSPSIPLRTTAKPGFGWRSSVGRAADL